MFSVIRLRLMDGCHSALPMLVKRFDGLKLYDNHTRSGPTDPGQGSYVHVLDF